MLCRNKNMGIDVACVVSGKAELAVPVFGFCKVELANFVSSHLNWEYP